MSAAMNSMSMASSAQMMQYSMGVMNMGMRAEAASELGMLDMLPQQTFQVRGPQPGDTPAVMKGEFFDTYA